MKGRTDGEGPDRRQDTAADTTSRRGGSEGLSDGKHGDLQDEPLGPFALRALCPSPIGTAGYGPVCPVVPREVASNAVTRWDPWLAE